MNTSNKTPEQLQDELAQKQKQYQDASQRLGTPGISEDSVRALIKTRNELFADIQYIQIQLHNLSKPFLRSLNESYEL